MKNVPDILASLPEVIAGARPWKAKGLTKAEELGVRRYYVDLLRMDGRCAYDISRVLGVPDTTVRRDIKDLEAEELVGKLADVRAQKRGEVYKRLLRIIEKAEEHRQGALQRLTVTRKSAKQDGEKKTAEVEDRQGAPDFLEANRALAIQLDAVDRVSSIFGLDVKKFEHTGEDGAPLFKEHDSRLDAFLAKAATRELQRLVDGTGAGSARPGGRRRTSTQG